MLIVFQYIVKNLVFLVSNLYKVSTSKTWENKFKFHKNICKKVEVSWKIVPQCYDFRWTCDYFRQERREKMICWNVIKKIVSSYSRSSKLRKRSGTGGKTETQWKHPQRDKNRHPEKKHRSADKMQSVFNKATESRDSLPRRSFPKIQKFSLLCKIELISSRRTGGKKDNYHTHVSSHGPFRSCGLRIGSMDKSTKKTPDLKCRLYSCLIEFIDWRYSQACLYFRPALWTIAPLSSLWLDLDPPPFPVWISTLYV